MHNTLNTEKLGRMVKAKCAGRGLRDVSEEIGGVSPSTLSRVIRGSAPDMETFLKLCDWLQIPASQLVETGESIDVLRRELSTVERIVLQIRADKNLDEATAQALGEVIRAVYQGNEP